jgi:hypothetical protein
LHLLFGPARSERTCSNKCDAGDARLETAGFSIMSLRSKPASAALMWLRSPAL